MKLYITALVNKMIVIIWSVHCDCVLPVRKNFLRFLPSAGGKSLRTADLGAVDEMTKSALNFSSAVVFANACLCLVY